MIHTSIIYCCLSCTLGCGRSWDKSEVHCETVSRIANRQPSCCECYYSGNYCPTVSPSQFQCKKNLRTKTPFPWVKLNSRLRDETKEGWCNPGSTVVAKAEHRQQCNLSSSAQLNTSRRMSLGKTYGAPTRWRAGPAKQEARQSPELWREKKGKRKPTPTLCRRQP